MILDMYDIGTIMGSILVVEAICLLLRHLIDPKCSVDSYEYNKSQEVHLRKIERSMTSLENKVDGIVNMTLDPLYDKIDLKVLQEKVTLLEAQIQEIDYKPETKL